MHLTIRRAVLALGVSAMIAAPTVTLASATTGHVAGTHIVIIKHKRFNPSTLTIKRGESVTWLWRDGNVRHNVTGPGFHSPTQSHGSFTVKFSRKGTFRYICTIHVSMGMVGKIIVH